MKTVQRTNAAELAIKPWDTAELLTSEARINGYLNEAAATGDPAMIQLALGTVARARGIGKVAKESGLSRENLYRVLSAKTAANFSTVVSVADALGFMVAFRPKKARPARKPRAKVPAVIARRGARKAGKSKRTG